MPAPPFNPTDYWATRKWVVAYVARATAEITREIAAIRADIASMRETGIFDDAQFESYVARNGVAHLADIPTLEGDPPYRLDRNEDLYVALSRIIPVLGGAVEGA